MNAQLVVLFARKFGWSLEDIGKLSPQQASDLANELAYQEALDDYTQSYRFAFLASVINNLWNKRRVNPQQLIGAMPTRENCNDKEARLFALAKQTRRKHDECAKDPAG